MAETLQGWSAPIYQGLAEPMLWVGVPPMFLLATVLGTLLATLFTLRAPLVGLCLHVAMARLTAWEPQWWKMLWSYARYAAYYEG